MERSGDRIKSTPIYLPSQEKPSILKRLPFTEKLLQEDWLQSLIHQYPSILPTNEIEPIFSPLVSLGREVGASSWSIDNLFISPEGYLTIVETKLWRNPEGRREVVGQIIEYAKEVSTWTFDDLDHKVRERNTDATGNQIGVIDVIRRANIDIEEESESDLIDSITRNMQRSRFLLLIVGDGIRESTKELAEYLSLSPQLHFTLALVELMIYQFNEGRLIIPQLVTRTREITRAIIRFDGNQIQQISVDTDVGPESDSSKSKRYTLSEDEYFALLQERTGPEEVEFAKQLKKEVESFGCFIEMKQASYTIRYRDPLESNQKLSLLIVSSYGTIDIAYLPDQLSYVGLPADIAQDYKGQLQDTLRGCEYKGRGYQWRMKPAISRLEGILSALESLVARIEAAAQEILVNSQNDRFPTKND